MKQKKILFGRPQKKRSAPLPDQIEIQSLSHEGRGIAKHNGKTLFISGALPGETVRFKIDKSHRRYDEGHCTEVVQASVDRTEPGCPHYGVCGGCDLQHLNHSAQIRNKEALVLDQLQRLGGITPDRTEPPIESTEFGYRRSSRIGINQRQSDGSAIVGFRRRGSNKLTTIENCPVFEPALNKILQQLPTLLEEETQFKEITHAEITQGDSEAALILRITKNLPEILSQKLDELARNEGFRLYFDNGKQITPYNKPADLFYHLPSGQVKLKFLPGDFIQVNRQVNEKMVVRALEWLELSPQDRILDLFCGIGNFTLPLASAAGHVVGIEGVSDMVQRATDNAKHNKLENCEFHRADLTKDLRALPWFKQGFNKILLDPPRAGANEVIDQLQNYQADKVLYISCNPAALARDAKKLHEQGYKLSRFCVMDMFPQTSHVESMALFEMGS